ncbi:hypothetical protein AAVH_37239, partial [Aphelenchoides avenae]
MTTKKELQYEEAHGLPVVPAPTVAQEARPDRQDVQGQTDGREIQELLAYREILGVLRPQWVHQELRVRWDRPVTPGLQEHQAGQEECPCQDHQDHQEDKDRPENRDHLGRKVLLVSLLNPNQSCADHQVLQVMLALLDHQDRPVSQVHQDYQDQPDRKARLVLPERQVTMESQVHPVAMDREAVQAREASARNTVPSMEAYSSRMERDVDK